jgi:lipoate-protein ligase A
MVFIDKNQLFCQWIFEPKHLPVKTDSRFQLFIKPLVETYKFFGINARFRPPNDVHVGFRKIVGTGAATIGNAEVVTGNFLFDFDCEMMAKVLKVPNEKFRETAFESLQKYMTSIKRELDNPPDIEEVKSIYIKKCEEVLGRKIVVGDFTDEEYEVMESLDKKFVTKEWLYQFSSNSLRKRVVKIHADVWLFEVSQETEGGIIQLVIRTKRKRIDQISIKGDFEIRPANKLKGLENVLRNVEISKEALTEVLEAFYELHEVKTPGISIQDWVEAIIQCKM